MKVVVISMEEVESCGGRVVMVEVGTYSCMGEEIITLVEGVIYNNVEVENLVVEVEIYSSMEVVGTSMDKVVPLMVVVEI